MAELPSTERASALAVLLNANAARVSPRTRRLVERLLPGVPVLWTENLGQADQAIAAALDRGVTTFLAGGGDGTIAHLAGALRRRNSPARIGVLRLGTGNGLANWSGARSPAKDLRSFRDGDPIELLQLRLMEAEGQYFSFCGTGWDAAILNDYQELKRRLRAGPLRRFAHQVWVYGLAAAIHTVPRYMRDSQAPQATVTVEQGPAWRVDARGRRVGEIFAPGDVIYEGPAHFCGFGTTPCYGFEFRIFPQAETSLRHLHLRISSMEVAQVLWWLPRLWRGTIDHPQMHDFLVEAARVRFDRPVPLQMGGDAKGPRGEISVRRDPVPVPVISPGMAARRAKR